MLRERERARTRLSGTKFIQIKGSNVTTVLRRKKKYENGVFPHETHQLGNLKVQQSAPVILDLSLRKTRAGK